MHLLVHQMVLSTGVCSTVMRKAKMLALGVYPEITLADARVRRDETRKLLANGVDPGDKKKNDKVEQSKARTFKEVAIEWHGTNKKWSEDPRPSCAKSLEDNLLQRLVNVISLS